MNLQVLVSTMNQDNYELIEKMNLDSDAIILNQCNKESEEVIKREDNKILWINSKERGLSRSRNKVIEKSDAHICVVADDDLIYTKDYKKKITEQFENNPDMDILTFKVEAIERKHKTYPDKPKKINKISAMKISSYEIAFRADIIKRNNIKFKEEFGSGSVFSMGEENIFLYECLKKKLKIKYIPLKIADMYLGESSWFKGYNEKYFKDRGAGYTAMGKYLALILILQFAVRKRSLYKDTLSFFKAVNTMLEGRKIYLKEYVK